MTESLQTKEDMNSFYANSGSDSDFSSDNDSDSADHSDEDNMNWLKDYHESEADYNEFYLETPTSIFLYFIYVAKNGEVEGLAKETHLLEKNGILKTASLANLISARKTRTTKKYDLQSVVKYNITANPRQVLNIAIETKDEIKNNDVYLNEIDITKDIEFEKTACVLQDLNCLFVILREQVSRNTAQTRRVRIRNPKYAEKQTHGTRRKRV